MARRWRRGRAARAGDAEGDALGAGDGDAVGQALAPPSRRSRRARRARRARAAEPDAALATGDAAGSLLDQADRLGLDLDEAVTRSGSPIASQAVVGEDLLDLVGLTFGSANLISQRVPPV